MSSIFKLCPTHFSEGAKKFGRGFAPPGYGPASDDVDIFLKTETLVVFKN